jgi:hypothetical protein
VYREREDSVNAQILKTIEPYQPRRLIVDQHQAQPVRSFFETEGIFVDVQSLTGPLKTSMFVSLRARLENGSLRCWAHPQLVADILKEAEETDRWEDGLFGPDRGDEPPEHLRTEEGRRQAFAAAKERLAPQKHMASLPYAV